MLPSGTVLDGELLAWRGEAPLPFAQLQRRLNRRTASISLQREVPVVFMGFRRAGVGRTGHPPLAVSPAPTGIGTDRCAGSRNPQQRRRRHSSFDAGRFVCRRRASSNPECGAERFTADTGRFMAGRRHCAGAGARSRDRRANAQAPGFGLRRGPSTRRLVEVEGNAVHLRRRAGSRPTRPWPPRHVVYGLHLRRSSRARNWSP